MGEGLPTDMPAAVVDEDETPITRKLVRVLDAMEMADVGKKYYTFSAAREAMQQGEIYAFFYIPKGTTAKAISSRQPRVSFYTNDAYLVPGNLLMKDMKMTGELIPLALTREKLRAKGLPETEMMAWLQPIKIEAHPIGNPTLDYNVYLSNMVVPGIFILLILLTTVYTIGYEWKRGTQCGIGTMMLIGLLTVLASQGFGVLLFGIQAGMMRVAMCICSLWGILSFSLAGFTYPVTDMHPVLQALSVWFPLRHYYLIYVNQALDGFPIRYVWPSVCWLVAFCVSPLLVHYRYRKAFLKFVYLP